MQLIFDSIEEVKEFVKQLKGTRGGKGDKDEVETAAGQVPAPMQPPQQSILSTVTPQGNPNTFNPGGFAPPAPGAAQPGMAWPAAAAPAGQDPAVLALVTRIFTKVEDAVKAGSANPDQALVWFRGQCGNEAAAATMDQIKTVFMPRLTVPALENIAKQMNA